MISLTPTTTLELKNSGTAEQTLQDIRSNSGSIKSLQGNYSVRNISSPASQTNVALEVGSDDTNSSLAANNITLVGSATVFGNSKLISGTPVVVKHFRIKFFFSLAKQDLFPYFFGCLGILFEVKCVCCCIQKRPIYQSLQAVSRTSIDSICLP